jgi:hypothetical protein
MLLAYFFWIKPSIYLKARIYNRLPLIAGKRQRWDWGKLCGQRVVEAEPFSFKGRECFFSGAEIQIIRPGRAGCVFPGFRIWTPAGLLMIGSKKGAQIRTAHGLSKPSL